jgi:hypothetical protein
MQEREIDNMRARPSASIAAFACAVMIAACSGETDDPDPGGQQLDGGQLSDSGQSDRTPEQVQADIRAEIDALNSCTVVEDCTGVGIPGTCSSGYINAGADRSNLDALLAEYSAVGGLEPPCAAICEMGILSCSQGRCETRPASASDPVGEGEISICL